ncbi:GRIP and coiled-coil domain-containing protein 1-like isoform X1 [Bombus pyrosoma]|uniref:GRIP and coiled-coil domain-containing protein 1-like isoform X1 n=1 Tax=Bombus pyrosoma TaxID=396416 RepID=UPI001CB9D48C|nr:GRIP and coiled-coil domain-containing protein 1-like isoform X1 [Bombus pyrosoma]XP_043604291.1 GRIP and coiled-coil domain-containing protein 1-like isoform X1 [Bombus pyrosoma]
MENEEKMDKKSIIVESEKDKSVVSSQTEKMGNTKNVQSQKSDTTNTGNDELIHSRQSREVQTDIAYTETVGKLKNRLDTLMNSLATLSAEKSKMEASFQQDKKQLRNERDECEKIIKDLKEKLNKVQTTNYSEIEHVKCKLIMERHEREREQADHAKMIKELQKLLHDERRNKEQLEAQVKSQFAHKTQCKILEAELEIARNKLKQAEEAAKETPPILLSLQSEMALMKKQHLNAIHEEQKRAAAAEQQARALAMTHEARVAGLEARLAELSEIVGGYDRLRQQDQQAIQKLKDQLINLQDSEHEYITLNNEPEEIISRIKNLYTKLLDLDNKKSESAHVKSLLHSLDLYDKQQVIDYKEKYEILLQEFEDYKQQMKYSNVGNISYNIQSQNIASSYDKNSKTQLHILKAHNNNLEERIRVLSNEIVNKERELKLKLEHQEKSSQEEHGKLRHLLLQKDNEFRNKISTLEQQLLRQRERSMALIEEKDKEILTLKTSFHALLPKKENTAERKLNASKCENGTEPITDLVTGLLTNDSPPILHYSQELARKEVQVSASRKKVLELEATLREKQREVIYIKEKQKENIKALQAQIARLEACKSREGANLEYLKNVFINYLTTSDVSSKRHMLNAISTVLRFTAEELNKAQNVGDCQHRLQHFI